MIDLELRRLKSLEAAPVEHQLRLLNKQLDPFSYLLLPHKSLPCSRGMSVECKDRATKPKLRAHAKATSTCSGFSCRLLISANFFLTKSTFDQPSALAAIS
jgi:hypothetical protein